MEDIIEQEKKYLVEVLGKKLIDSDEYDNSDDYSERGYLRLAKKYWPEEFIGDEPKEVHHIDFDRTNNAVSNLVVLTRSEHMKIHYMFDSNYSHTLGKHWKLSDETKKRMSIAASKRPKGRHWKLVNGKRVWY